MQRQRGDRENDFYFYRYWGCDIRIILSGITGIPNFICFGCYIYVLSNDYNRLNSIIANKVKIVKLNERRLTMVEKEILQKLYDRSMEKVFSMSANYLMTIPKKGFEKEFREEREIAEYLQLMIASAD